MRLRLAGLLCALLSFSALIGRAELWQSKELNFSINLPTEEGWTQLGAPNKMLKVAARSVDQKFVVSVVVAPTGESMIPEEFLSRFKKQWFKNGTSRKTSDTPVQVDGQSGSCIKDIAMMNGKAVYRADTVFINGGNLYNISTIGSESDPLTDAAVKEVVGSFKFLNKSTAMSPAPVSKRPSTLRPSPVNSVRATSTDKIPQLVADLTIAVMVLILIAWTVSKIIGGRKAGHVRPPAIPGARQV